MVKVIKVKLNDLATAEVLVESGDYLASFDLETSFFMSSLLRIGFHCPLRRGYV